MLNFPSLGEEKNCNMPQKIGSVGRDFFFFLVYSRGRVGRVTGNTTCALPYRTNRKNKTCEPLHEAPGKFTGPVRAETIITRHVARALATFCVSTYGHGLPTYLGPWKARRQSYGACTGARTERLVFRPRTGSHDPLPPFK